MIRLRIPKARALRPNFSLSFSLSFLFSILALLLPLYSCSSKTITSFPWNSSEGKPLAFAQTKDFPEGRENSFGPGRERNAYKLGEAIALPQGYMVAAELSAIREDLVLGFSLGPEVNKQGEELRFALPKGRSRFYISLPAGRSLRVLSLNLSAGAPGKPGDFEEWARLESVEILPAFRGFEELEGGYRVSDGISIKKPEPGASRISIQNPFASFGAGIAQFWCCAIDRRPNSIWSSRRGRGSWLDA